MMPGGIQQAEEECSGAYLVWEDLTAVIQKDRRPRRLIDGLTGYAVPGRITAIMGPSGSGKSTLLDSLAGRVASNVVLKGKVLLNGKKRRLDYGVVAYVTQENTLLGTLTVRETIWYSARLRLSSSRSEGEVRDVVEGTIIQMGLSDCADRTIGNWHLRGISGGEKKRLSIALEIVTSPNILFLDEPTTGLDSASAFFVMQTLRQMAREGKTVVSSVHQPSGEVYSLFDDLCLLSSGESVYFGEAKLATEFFAQVGLRCPRRRNPSDHFLRCINTDFDIVNETLKQSRINKSEDSAGATSDPLINMETSTIKNMLVDRFPTSGYADMVRKHIAEISRIEDLAVACGKGSQAGWWTQLKTLIKRSSLNMSRDFGYYWLRILVYILVSLCVGTIFYDVGTSHNSILARASSGGFVSGFMTFMSIGGFPSFVEEMKVFHHERLNGHYGVGVYTISNLVSSTPFLFAISLSSGTITYFMVKLHPGISHFLYFLINLHTCMAIIESLMMIVASLVPNFLMGMVIGAGVIGIMMMTAGFFRLLSDLPKPFWRYPVSYISYGSWALQGQYKNDFLGLEFDAEVEGRPKLTGEYVIKNIYGISLDHSKWVDLAILVILLISYRSIFFLVLKLQEKAKPLLRGIHERGGSIGIRTMFGKNGGKKKKKKKKKMDGSSFSTPGRNEQPLYPLACHQQAGFFDSPPGPPRRMASSDIDLL